MTDRVTDGVTDGVTDRVRQGDGQTVECGGEEAREMAKTE